MLGELAQFVGEFFVTMSNILAVSKQAYVNGNYNIDLLQLHHNTHYNTLYENTTAQEFFHKIIRQTRSFGNSHKLIDNVFINNLCKRHTSGISTHQIFDYFITFNIVDGSMKNVKEPITYVEVKNINLAKSIVFKKLEVF